MPSELVVRKIRGLDTAWLESGPKNAPLLVFLHGFPDAPELWDEADAHFSDRFHVLRPYARGVAPSEPSAQIARYGTECAALDHLEMLKHADPTGRRPVWLVGHDLGAAHAWTLAPLLGPRLSGLVILNGMSIAQMVRRLTNLRQQKKSWYIYFMQLPWFPEKIVPRAIDAPPERLLAPLNQYRAMVREIPRQWKRGPRLQAPVLLVWGNRDPYLETPRMEELTRFASRVSVRILEAGHWVMREKPREVYHALEGFFEGKASNGSGSQVGI